jgi:PAS domain S-box-containing protein
MTRQRLAPADTGAAATPEARAEHRPGPDIDNAHLRQVLDTLDEGYCVLEMILNDADGRPVDYLFIDTNPAFERHTGLVNAVGRRARELVPELEDHWTQIYGRVARTGESEHFSQGSTAMGRWFDVEAFRVGEPGQLRVALLFRDVTASRSTDQRLRAIVENIVDYAIYATDAEGRVTEWTLGAERLKGYTAEEVMGRHVEMFYPEEDRQRGIPRADLDAALRDGRDEREGWKVRRNGELFLAHEVTTAMRTPDGRSTGFTRISRDLTQQRAVEQAREAQLESEKQAREEAEDFLGLLSHELRTPVTSIFGTASLIARDVRRPDVAELIRDVQEEADRLVRLIDDLLMVSRVDRGLIQLDPEPLLLQHVIPQVMADVRRRGLPGQFNVEMAPFLPPVVADPTALHQVLYNLLSNAAKYAGQHGPIALAVEPRDSVVELLVRDQGPGLGQDPERLFELHYRNPETARLAPGTGVGLYVARELMNAMDGSVDGWTGQAGGAVFRLRIPAAHDDS